MEKPHLALVAPSTVYGTVGKAGPPKRRRNAEVRSREFLTDAEVNRLISAAGENRNGHRDATMDHRRVCCDHSTMSGQGSTISKTRSRAPPRSAIVRVEVVGDGDGLLLQRRIRSNSLPFACDCWRVHA
jgi:hypothetical protein